MVNHPPVLKLYKKMGDGKKILLMQTIAKTTSQLCSHCQSPVWEVVHEQNGKVFCCQGCLLVHNILQEVQLCAPWPNTPTQTLKKPDPTFFAHYDSEKFLKELCDFYDGQKAIITLSLPDIHCPSCIWLIERLPKLEKGVESSRVHFGRKEATIRFNLKETKLSQILAWLSALGYEANFRLDSVEKPVKTERQKKLLLRLAVAGFAFGNIMLFSLPEYFDENLNENFKRFFTSLNFALALPVLLYSAQEFFASAFQALRRGGINMDVPIALGIIAMFVRTFWEILTKTGPGYMDTFTGLIFLLLVGRYFQEKSHQALRFDRDYRAFLPLAVKRVKNHKEETVNVKELQEGDVIHLRHGELLVADAKLLQGEVYLDYSFITGEQEPRKAMAGEELAAGGRIYGNSGYFVLLSRVNQSRLSRLWEEHLLPSEKEAPRLSEISQKLSPAFTIFVLFLAITGGIYWAFSDWAMAFNVLTGVLIIACPCALAMAAPFSLGHGKNILAKNGLFLKDTYALERLSQVEGVVFDKTGTLTYSQGYEIHYEGLPLSVEMRQGLKYLFGQSVHPLSRALYNHLGNIEPKEGIDFQEFMGKGLLATIDEKKYIAGSEDFFKSQGIQLKPAEKTGSQVHLAIDQNYYGYFSLRPHFREGLKDMLKKLKMPLYVLSGDREKDWASLRLIFPENTQFWFRQSPEQKLQKVQEISKKQNVLMLGDGLNDAGALKAAKVGIAVSDDHAFFTPASDGILEGRKLMLLNKFLQYSKDIRHTILLNFGISFLYNTFGLSYALKGLVTPLFCAILMPVSSITVLISSFLVSRFFAYYRGLIWK